jgi:hypothetical protein
MLLKCGQQISSGLNSGINFLEIVVVSYNLYVGMASPKKLATAIKFKTEIRCDLTC